MTNVQLELFPVPGRHMYEKGGKWANECGVCGAHWLNKIHTDYDEENC